MPLDPTIKRLLAKAYLNGFGDIHHFTLEQVRRYLSHPKIKVAQASFQDFTIQSGLTLRCYTPTQFSPDTMLPAVIYLSATAFVLDRLDPSNDYCSLLANNLGMKVIHLSHRLAPEHKFPGYLNDALTSIKWIDANARALKIEKEKIAIWGESSGGSIVATCTHVLRDEGIDIIKHQTLFYPMVDLVSPFPSKETYAKGYMLDKPFLEYLDNLGSEPTQDRSSILISPLLSPSFENLPPATMITAEYDPLRDEAERYAQKLNAANVPVVAKRFDGMIHGFMRFYTKVQGAREALDFACGKLKRIFNGIPSRDTPHPNPLPQGERG
ncbi:MAG: alpha/beta hydrolase [Gammaproteobacteria bacterium]|nr:alpha/beta hydrolase [Gammaproteobacteria bacterium]